MFIRTCCFVFLLFTLITGCSIIKLVKTLKGGSVLEESFETTIPFELEMGLIIIKARVNGIDGKFLLDTGAPSVLSTEFASRTGVIGKFNQETGDSQGKKEDLSLSTVDTIIIGDIHFIETGTAIASMSTSREIACLKLDGFIGANLMRKGIWQIDYIRQEITITNTINNLSVPDNASHIPFKVALQGTPHIDIEYGPTKARYVTVDSGSNGDFSAPLELFQNKEAVQKSDVVATGCGVTSSGLYGANTIGDTVQFVREQSVRIGSLNLGPQVVEYKSVKSLLGNSFFKHHRVIFDWNENDLILIPEKKFDNSNQESFGFRPFYTDSMLIVGFLISGSGAERAGLRIGDQIIEVNGTNFSNCAHDCWCEIILKEKENAFRKQQDQLLIKVKRGTEELEFVIQKQKLTAIGTP